MATRDKLPDIMGEALGRLRITEAPGEFIGLGLPHQENSGLGRVAGELKKLRLDGMAKALRERAPQIDNGAIGLEELLGYMLQEEKKERRRRRLKTRLSQAQLRFQPSLEEVDFSLHRGLDQAYFYWLAKGEWLSGGDNLIITGPVGVGKTFLACALARILILSGRTALYRRAMDLGAELAGGRPKRDYDRFRKKLGRVDLLIIDDWGLEGLDNRQKNELMTILDERYGRLSSLIVSPLRVDRWPENETESMVDRSILDRILNQAHLLGLEGESLRKVYGRMRSPR